MKETVIKVENLGKCYQLSQAVNSKDDTLVVALGKKIRRGLTPNTANVKEDFWALKNVSFEISKGDRVGIIGRNGAGKSTLLKLLSRIVKPTSGRIEYTGRMASLLEVGTGFHGDLTGRENIYLNGSLIGMKKAEIDAKFDAIVAFSEIAQFLDTPVKRYSSGMYVRLGFAIAAHLEPEILIVDEVLAVGDSVFQKKCIDKMTDISNMGNTILFVSHNFATINTLCNTAILLEKGQVKTQGDVSNVFGQYYQTLKINESVFNLESLARYEHKQEIIFKEIRFEKLPISFGEQIKFSIKLKSKLQQQFSDLDFGVNFCDNNYNTVYHISNRFIHKNFTHYNDDNTYEFSIENNLKPGFYNLILFLRTADQIQDFLINRVGIEIMDGNPYQYNDTAQIQGSVLPMFSITQK
jgi:lipopolysaccharide transport system ATP-binding protein